MAKGDQSLVGARYSVLRSEATRTEKHQDILERICGRNLKTSRAWAMKETFQEFWNARTMRDLQRGSLNVGMAGRQGISSNRW